MRTDPMCVVVFLCFLTATASADDWPQWLGPGQASTWQEDGIVKEFPSDGLPIRWRVPVELGYAGPAVADGRVYVMDYVPTAGEVTNNPGGRDKLQGRERIQCFASDTGEQIWEQSYEQPYDVSFGGGPRCTPSVEQGRVYTLGAEGKLSCLDAQDGNIIWQRDFKEEYGVETPQWGFSAHPLVHGDRLFCVVGGEGSVVVAFDKDTGQEIWRALSAPEPGYCGPTMIEHAGAKQLLVWHPESVNGLDPDTGEVHWSVPLRPNSGMSISPPRKYGDYLYASGYGDVAVLLELAADRPDVEVVWRGNPKNAVYSANSPAFLEQGMIYGTDLELGALMGVRMSDGERLWQTFEPTTGGQRRARYGTAFLVQHEDRYFLFSETGDLILAQLSPKGYEEISRFHVLDPTERIFGRDVVWSHPAFAMRCIFARNDKELVCVSLASDRS
jgi:outer membrane protein assembly factor BamB